MFTYVEKVLRMPPVINDTSLWLKQAFPFPVVVTLVLYTMGASTYVSSWRTDIESRINGLEKIVEALNSHENRIVVLEQQFIRIREDLSEIKLMIREQKKADIDLKGTLK